MNILDFDKLDNMLNELQNKEVILHMSLDTMKILPPYAIESYSRNNGVFSAYKGFRVYEEPELSFGEIKIFQEMG